MGSEKSRGKPSWKEEFLFWKRTVSGYGLLFSAAVFLMILSTLCGIISPLFQKHLINALTHRCPRDIAVFALLTAVTLLCSRFGSGLQQWFCSLFQLRCSAALKRRFFRHLLELPLGAVESVGSGYIGQKLHYDVEAAVSFFSHELLFFFLNFFRFFGVFVLLLLQSFRIGCCVLPVLALFIFLTFFFREKQYVLGRQISEAAAAFRQTAQNSLDRLQLFKTQAWEGFAGERIDEKLNTVTELRIRLVRMERLFWFLLMLVPAFVLAAVFTLGTLEILAERWTLGDLWSVTLLLAMLFVPARNCCLSLIRKRVADASLERLLELEKMLPEKGLHEGIVLQTVQGEVDFDRLWFAYPGGEELFYGFSLHLSPGEHLLLTGSSGAGKSTLGALLMRLYEPSRGEIRLDGKGLAEYELHSLRRAIGYIGQATEQFCGTVRENLGREYARFSDEKLFAALRVVGLEDRVRQTSGGLDASLHENAGNFSAGERLRLALARELLRKPQVLLLDEITANLDQESCEKVYDLLRGEWKECTVLLISHRPFPADVISRICTLS